MKYSIKMIAVDLDGTLLKSDKTISEHTKNVLKACREKGIKVVFATGRGYSSNDLVPSELFDGRIIHNGAKAFIKDKIYYDCLIPYQTSKKFLVVCDKFGLKGASQFNGIHYSNYGFNDVINYQLVDFNLHNQNAEKIYFIIKSPEDVNFIKKHIPSDLNLSITRDNYAIITNKEATKSKAIKALADFWDIKEKEIAIFGDDVNDTDMFSYAGFGVAMGNAVPSIKQIAGFNCPDNDSDGIAVWLIENVL